MQLRAREGKEIFEKQTDAKISLRYILHIKDKENA